MGRWSHHPFFNHSWALPSCMVTLPPLLWVLAHSSSSSQHTRQEAGCSSGIFTAVAEIFRRETKCLCLIITQCELDSWPLGSFSNIQARISSKSIFFFYLFLSPLLLFFITRPRSDIVLWQAVRAKLKHCSCCNPSLSHSFPFLMPVSGGLLITTRETDLFHLWLRNGQIFPRTYYWDFFSQTSPSVPLPKISGISRN